MSALGHKRTFRSTSYDGTGGIPIGTFLRKNLFAWHFSDINLLLSSYITSESRIMVRREIREGVHTIAPFLRLDRDPYLVVNGGRLYWIQDAYTTSDYFPYAQSAQRLDLNYIRNSVKIVIDAYNGTVDFYLTDAADRSLRHTSEFSQTCSSHSQPCRRTCRSIFAILKISFGFRRKSASTKSLGNHVEIRIRDNGTGILPEIKEKMFNPFFTTKPAGEGTGLGLSISHDIIVKQHGGSIEVDTQPGEFTEVQDHSAAGGCVPCRIWKTGLILSFAIFPNGTADSASAAAGLLHCFKAGSFSSPPGGQKLFVALLRATGARCDCANRRPSVHELVRTNAAG